MDEILAAIERARTRGATVLTGGVRTDDDGCLIPPTVVEGVADDAELCEGVFGPVTSLYRYTTLDEAIARRRGAASPRRCSRAISPRYSALAGSRRDHPRELADCGRRRARALRRRQGSGWEGRTSKGARRSSSTWTRSRSTRTHRLG